LDKFLDNRLNQSFKSRIVISGSKSESNRLLILQKLFQNFEIQNLSNSNDTSLLKKALQSNSQTIDIGHAGTAMRFLTTYFAVKTGSDIILTGSERMQQRPIKILVEALQELGADIAYLKEKGFPPLRIKGKEFTKNEVQINGNVSSQYISALLLIAPSLKNGLTIELQGEITSKPYIDMTLSLLVEMNIKAMWHENKIKIFPIKKKIIKTVVVESDWSSASYFYSLVALSRKGEIQLSYFKENGLQGDNALTEIYKQFGVKTTFNNDTITLTKNKNFKPKKHISFNLIKTPDIAQTIAVTCLGLGISCGLSGLHTLKIKETDRLQALKNELQKFGAKVRITNDSLHLKGDKIQEPRIKTQDQIQIQTYDDHRMAMAFAPLSLITPIIIKDAEVVKKSYPDFWIDLEGIKK
jgi:3-phosphoshikimate 1-carboxyvinyltransferase